MLDTFMLSARSRQRGRMRKMLRAGCNGNGCADQAVALPQIICSASKVVVVVRGGPQQGGLTYMEGRQTV